METVSTHIANFWQLAGVVFGFIGGFVIHWAWQKVWQPAFKRAVAEVEEDLKQKEATIRRYKAELVDYRRKYLTAIHRYGGKENDNKEGQGTDGPEQKDKDQEET